MALVLSLLLGPLLVAGCGGEGGSANVETYRVDSAGITLGGREVRTDDGVRVLPSPPG